MSVGRAAGREDFFAHKKGRGGTPTSRPHVWKPHALLPRLERTARGRCTIRAMAVRICDTDSANMCFESRVMSLLFIQPLSSLSQR